MRNRRPKALYVIIVCLALLLGAVTATTGTAAVTANPATFGPFDPRIEMDGHWGRDDDVAITVNPGSSLRFRFTGEQLGAWFDTASITAPAQLSVSIDRGEPMVVTVDEDHKIFAEGLDPMVAHTAEILVKSVDEHANRWIMPLQSGVILEKIELAPAAKLIPLPTIAEYRLEFYGDSVTPGVDSGQSYAQLVGTAFGADTNEVGFGTQGIIQPAAGNVGTASESFGWNLADFPAAPFDPGAVVVNFGAGDASYSSAEFTPKYLAYLRQVRAAYPKTLILAMRPFDGTHADSIATAVQAAKDRKIVYVDTTGWLGADDFDGTHPNVKGHQVAAGKLTRVVERRTGWRPSRPGDAVAPVLTPRGTADSTCSDTPLRLTFAGPVQLGVTGKLRIHRAGGDVVDTIDLADLTSYQRFVGDARSDFGELHQWTYEPVVVDGRTISIHPHQRLAPGQVYYVTLDPGFVVGHPGITQPSAWMFRTRHDPPAGATRLTVDGRGQADFCTVQSAIDFVQEGNAMHISVAPGMYRELVYVPQTKPHITIIGAGAGRTVIGYPNNNLLNGDFAMGNVPIEQAYCPRRVIAHSDRFNCWRAAMGVDADDFTLTDVTVHNLTPYRGSAAEAFRGNGERIVLARVRILGNQDSLRLQGKGFVTDSYIEGDIDFVWGTGGVFVQDSELKALRAGYYNQVRNIDDGPGNIFVRVRLTRGPDAPDDSVFLSRAELNRFPTSQVVFLDSAMDTHVKKVGWLITNPNDCAAADQIRFWEHGSTDLAGRPLDTSARLACSRQLSDDEATWLRDPSNVFDGWHPAVPRPER